MNLLLYVFLNLNFKLRHVVCKILMLNFKVNLKCINEMSFK